MARKGSAKDPPSAYDKALGLLARREHSVRELKIKLARRGLDPGESAAALEKLKAKDYQSDARFGEMLVRSRIEGGYGPRWILAELRTHGLDEARSRTLLDDAAVDWPAQVRRQLRRRYGGKAATTATERAKRAGFLLRRGFDASAVKLAVGDSGMDEPPGDAD